MKGITNRCEFLAVCSCCKSSIGRVKPAKEFLQLITDLSIPTNIKEGRAFNGLVNQVNYAFWKSDAMELFRHMLSPETLLMDCGPQTKFEKAKGDITEKVKEGVMFFNKEKKTC